MLLDELNWKTWGLILLIALGGSFELIKRLPTSKGGWDLGFRSNSENEKPYAVRGTRSGLLKAHRNPPAMLPGTGVKAQPRVAQNLPPMSKEQLAALVATQNKAPEKDPLVQNPDDFETVIDPKTGKAIKRKKKKKKKDAAKKDKTTDTAAKLYPTKDSDSDWGSNDNDIDAAVSRTITTGELQPAPPKEDPDKGTESAEEWMRKLLNRPNLAETNRFIDHYKRGLITADVYYRIVRAMVEDSRPEMKKLGIMAASQVLSPLSFQILAKVIQSERADSDIGKVANEALNRYTEFGRLDILKRILSASSSGYIPLVATEKLQQSAVKNLKPVTQSSSTSTPPSQTVQTMQVTAYRNFIPILNNLLKSSDQAVKDQAAQTLSTIQGLLGTATSTTAALDSAPDQALN